MKITKTIYVNGDYSIDTDCDHIPFQKIKEEFEQDIEIDETKWKKIEETSHAN
jgi:hypothetical protein